MSCDAFELLLSSPSTMRATSSTQYSQVISLLHEGYSLCQIQFKTGLGKSTVGRIKKTVDQDKENFKGGHLSKLSTHDKILIVTSGKLDNAVQAAKFINKTISNPVAPQTIRDMLRKNNFWSVTKTKHPLLKQKHCDQQLKFFFFFFFFKSKIYNMVHDSSPRPTHYIQHWYSYCTK